MSKVMEFSGSRGWLCAAGVVGQGVNSADTWEDPGNGNGDKNAPTGHSRPHPRVGQRSGGSVMSARGRRTCLASEESDLQDPGSSSSPDTQHHSLFEFSLIDGG